MTNQATISMSFQMNPGTLPIADLFQNRTSINPFAKRTCELAGGFLRKMVPLDMEMSANGRYVDAFENVSKQYFGERTVDSPHLSYCHLSA